MYPFEKINHALEQIMSTVRHVRPEIKLVARPCLMAEEAHLAEERLYCHVGHEPGTICCSQALAYLPDDNLYGILAHEVGHVLTNSDAQSDADGIMLSLFGWQIEYGEDTLEALDPRDVLAEPNAPYCETPEESGL